MTENTRRDFLGWMARGCVAAASALAIGQVARYFSFEPPGEAPGIVAVGMPDAFGAGTVTYAPAARAYIGHDDGGLYAIDAVCTHLGCLVQQEPKGGFACPCHGSRFAAGGEVQNGPAGRPLQHLALNLGSDGRVSVDRSRTAAPEARLAVSR
jgi:cytochrome b6-f complex iron-sulfur subunit